MDETKITESDSALLSAYVQLLKNKNWNKRITAGYQLVLIKCRTALASVLDISEEDVQNECEAMARQEAGQ